MAVPASDLREHVVGTMVTVGYVVPPVATVFPPSEVSPATGHDPLHLGAAARQRGSWWPP